MMYYNAFLSPDILHGNHLKLETKLKSLSVLNVNNRLFKLHLEKLEALVLSLESPPDILCLTETWLTDNDDPKLFLVNGYSQYIAKKIGH